MIALAFLSTLVGMACLAVAMHKHARVLLKRALSRSVRGAVRSAGIFGLVSGIALCGLSQGPSVGLTYWFGLASAAALLVALGMTYVAGKET